MPKFAFLTEVRDCEAYLPKAIQSILNQTYKDFIYYIIDDGSTDNTRDIIKTFAQKDARISPFYWENNMLGNFNRALDLIYACGAEYFALLDSDDWYEPDFAQQMVEALETTGADLAEAKFLPHEENGTPTEELPGLGNEVVSLKQFADNFSYYSFFDSIQQWWCKVYRVSLMRQMGLQADVGWDNSFVLRYRTACKQYAMVDVCLHHYRIRQNSDCHKRITGFDGGKVAAALLEQHEARLELLKVSECENEESYLMSAYQDVNGVKSNMMRIYAGNVSPQTASLELPTLLSMPFLAQSYTAVQDAYEIQGTLFFANPTDSARAMDSIRSYYGYFLRLIAQQGVDKNAPLLFAWLCRVFPHIAEFFEETDLPLLMEELAIPILEQRYRAAMVFLYSVDVAEKKALLRVFCATKTRGDRRFFQAFLETWQGRLSEKKWKYLSLQNRR